MAGSVAERLKMSRAEIQHVLTLVKNQSRFDTIQTDSISALKRFLRLSRFEDHLELARICAVASDRDLADYDFAVKLRSKWSAEDIAPPLLISGDDLIAMGFTPGPHFKEILTRLEDEQLEGRLKSREEAAQFVKGEYLGAGGSR
jgi:poly(A) polymerase